MNTTLFRRGLSLLAMATLCAAPVAILTEASPASAASGWDGTSNGSCGVLNNAPNCLPWYVNSSGGNFGVLYAETNVTYLSSDQYGGYYWTGSHWQIGSAGYVTIGNGGGAVLLTSVVAGTPEQVATLHGPGTDTFLLVY